MPAAPDQDGHDTDQQRREDGYPDRLEHGLDPCRPGGLASRAPSPVPGPMGDWLKAAGSVVLPFSFPSGTAPARSGSSRRREEAENPSGPGLAQVEPPVRRHLGLVAVDGPAVPELEPPCRVQDGLSQAFDQRTAVPLATARRWVPVVGERGGRRNADQGERKQHDG
jgi:hypothetical protein